MSIRPTRRASTIAGLAAATVTGVLVGAVATLALQASGVPVRGGRAAAPTRPADRPEAPDTYLVWVPGGLPAGFASAVRGLEQIGPVTVVREDTVWLRRSWSEAGALVDHPSPPYRIPLDVAAVDPASFGRFLPPAQRVAILQASAGDAVLGATSAELRGLGPGATLALEPGPRVGGEPATTRSRHVFVSAVLPDELVGAAELVVSREAGADLGVRLDRYLLLRPADGERLTPHLLGQVLRPVLRGVTAERTVPAPELQIRAPGDTPYYRAGDAVLPPVLLKALFGEFAARLEPGRPEYLDLDPAWVRDHIATERVPLLGPMTCHVAILPQLRSAMRDVERSGLSASVHDDYGCFAPRLIRRDLSMISHHSWGVAFDMNLEGNYHGDPPHQDPRLVRLLERWGFTWGGRFVVPDGSHFEYHRAATTI